MIDPRFYTPRDGGLSVADLCSRLDIEGPVEGRLSEDRVFRPAALEGSQPGDLCFLMNKRAINQLNGAKATACFVPKNLAAKLSDQRIIPIVSPYPKYMLAKATELLVDDDGSDAEPDISPDAHIHPSAIVGAGVTIGAGTRIGPHCVIEKAIIGKNCQIGACTVIGGAGFGVAPGPNGQLLPVPHVGRVLIGDNVRIGSNVCVDRGHLGDTIIGSGSQIDNLVQVAHNCRLGENVVLAGRVGLSGSCTIGDGVHMGGSVGIADHITVGDGARLAAYAGVMHDVPAGETWSGIPAQPIRDHMKQIALARKSLRK